MTVIKCNCCKGFIAQAVPAFGYQLGATGAPEWACVNCPACRSTASRPMPDLIVGVKGIVAVGKKGPAFGLKSLEIKALVAA